MKKKEISFKRTLFYTEDGSPSFKLEGLQEQYHSVHGALQESRYVYIEKGLNRVFDTIDKSLIRVLEMGLGTGLNALLTALSAGSKDRVVNYVGVEGFPLQKSEWEGLTYADFFPDKPRAERIFKALHQAPWEEFIMLLPQFNLLKRKLRFEEFQPDTSYHLIYFDAFGARVQPELWTEPIFTNLYKALEKKGVLVTYSAKGSVRRILQKIGFTVERLPGPPGKREMLRGTKK